MINEKQASNDLPAAKLLNEAKTIFMIVEMELLDLTF